MLINCPRCGFSQPKDQYCAQCGVDMQSYKPKAVPIFKKVLRSGLFQVSALLFIAIFVGQSIIRSDEPQKWVQKMTRFQGVTKSTSKASNPMKAADVTEASSISTENELLDLKDQEIEVKVAAEKPLLAGGPATTAVTPVATENTVPTFRLTYAEVSRENLAKWVNDSSNAGLYQNLQEYSAGILTDFRKRTDITMTSLKSTEKKLALGQSETNLSGSVTADASSQMIGIISTIEYRANENGALHGSIVVSRSNRQTRENFPAEFDLPRGAVFFMIGTLKNSHFANEKARLNMAPFQIFNSPDFMTQKTEFVIILEPEYK